MSFRFLQVPSRTLMASWNTTYSWDSYSPSYFFANSDVPQKYLKRHGDGTVPGTTIYDIVVDRGTAPQAATQYDPNGSSLLAGLTKITYSAVDAWFEEDEKMFGHPKNPYHVRNCLTRIKTIHQLMYHSARRCPPVFSACPG